MLQYPASTFEPSQPAPSGAQPFDAQRYLQRAKQLGIMLFPSISRSGQHLYGLCAYPGYSFSDGYYRLAKEFRAELEASADGTAAVFDALCEDFELDAADPAFNDKVNAICHTRSRSRCDGDKRLIELCKKAKVALQKDAAATERFCDLTDEFGKVEPKKSTYITALGAEILERDDAQTMRRILKEGLSEWSPSAVRDYRARIAKVVTYEKECTRLSREVGLTQAQSASDAAGARAKTLIGYIVELPATTLLGMAWKAALLSGWKDAGYGLDDEGELLALSIADDARMIGTGGQVRRPLYAKSRQPSAQVH